ncbi:virulence factor SrfB [Breoghania sp. L-A4]|uniref:virulence factor SrfB n=1 Tax=Breoghania sp. L-A4 TaxID=2304600 RepID=UPI000E35C0A1|nr:virulence factor SrfB [Breoghania sp. L-A4]AXS40688.1 virulence factor SrfB-like protein [Breoghania sp. L-A4]
MLNKLVDLGEAFTLTPQSGIQFVEYGFDMAATPRFARSFIERPIPDTLDESGKQRYRLLPNWNDDYPDADPPYAPEAGDEEYDVTKDQAVRFFLNKWIPVPFLKIEPGTDELKNERHAAGPMDWVRARIVETRNTYGDTEFTHRVIFAFDTALVEQRPNQPYLGLSPDDSRQSESFRFVHRLRDIAAFLSNRIERPGDTEPVETQAWLINWLHSLHHDFKKARYPNRALRDDDFPYALEHVALFMTFIGFLANTLRPAKVTLVDTVSADPDLKPIDVDLVLDIGNARSCGLLIQSFPNDETTDLNRSLVLELRNLSRPELVYRDPFESLVELVPAEFGPEQFARMSTRSRAFFWPSVVRTGPEAAQFREDAEGTEATTGLSSPKRYLWDVDPVMQNWSFRDSSDTDPGTSRASAAPLIERSLYKFVNNRGDVLEQLEEDISRLRLKVLPEDRESADSFRFSRSSFFTFMLLELLAQAMMMINNPAVRRRDREKDSPRVLRRIIMTIPSATPVQEQRIIRTRTEAAIKLMWSLMGWTAETPGAPPMPLVHTSWDEASSVQLVYLYGEITQKLGGSIESFFDILGKPRIKMDHTGKQVGAAPEKSLRIASVDVGGGTTDLMITTYFQQDNRAITPVQNFREGFRRAGDDLLKLVVERAVIPAIEAHLKSCGLMGARDFLRERFTDSPGMDEIDKHLRRQFVLRVLRPVALGILSICEEEESVGRTTVERGFASFFNEDDARLFSPSRTRDYLEREAASLGAENFALSDVVVQINPDVITECIGAAFEKIFSNISEAIYKFDVDTVLLTGRPTCLPGVIGLFRNQLSVPVDRIIPIRDYRVGNWYPFRQRARSLIADPKTTAVVGGMLCALTAGQLTNFTLYTDGLVMRSTARFIGEMEGDGVVTDERLFFSDVDLDAEAGDGMEHEFRFHTAIRIGYRQLPRPDWVAAPLYRLRLKQTGAESRIKRPIEVTLERKELDVDEDAPDHLIMHSEATSEEFRISSAVDRDGKNVLRLMELKLDTSPVGSDGIYWLDSGILTIA